MVPGLGWDNLRNLETGMITSFSYSQCKVTYDRMYLIPDQTFAIPIKTSIVEHNSEYIENWDSYKSVTSRTINSGFDFFGRIGGKFSKEYLTVKSRMFNEKAVSTRTELRHRFHSIRQLPDSKLHPSFKNRLLDIVSLLKSDDTRAADYATQLLIRDYGTHYLVSVDAGAVLVQQDNLKSTVKTSFSGRTNSITAAGGVQFLTALNSRASSSNYNSQSDLTAYREHLTSSKLTSYGGPPYRIGMNVTEWEMNLSNNLVAVDRTGRPIHSVITTDNMKPEIVSITEIMALKNLVQKVVSRYYAFNTHLGCMDVTAQNFDYQANAPYPGACVAASRNYTFGGVFQTCSYISNSNGMCGNLIQKNPITGKYSCPNNYNSVLLLSGEVSRPKTDKRCHLKKRCSFLGFLNCRHEQECNYVQGIEKVRHETFWCAPNRERKPDTGYLFGGIYSNDLNNPVTRGKSCPTHYINMKIGSHAHICLSEDYELGHQFSLPFGGFFSCKSGNRLAINNTSDFLNNPRDWPMRCPGGFTQHLALTDNNCRVNFCVRAGTLLRATDLDIVLPPFEPRPGMKENSTMDFFDGPDPDAMKKFASGYDFTFDSSSECTNGNCVDKMSSSFVIDNDNSASDNGDLSLSAESRIVVLGLLVSTIAWKLNSFS